MKWGDSCIGTQAERGTSAKGTCGNADRCILHRVKQSKVGAYANPYMGDP